VDTLKTVFVVGLLGVVLYGAYALLSKKEGTPPPEVVGLTENLDDLSAPEVDLGPSLTPGLPDTELASYGNLSVDVDASPTDVQIPSYEQEPKKPVVIGGIIQDPDLETADPYGGDPYSEISLDNAIEQSRYAESQPLYGDQVSASVDNLAPKNPLPNSYLDDTTNNSNEVDVDIIDWASEKQNIDGLLAASQHVQALKQLSQIYRRNTLTQSQRLEALDMLDPLAGKVIYSREHLLEEPYLVQANESLMQVADKFLVPWQLLSNVNGIDNPEAGTPLKVVRGPFEAEVDTVNNEMTLYVNNMYAGRFAIAVGTNPAPTPGKFHILKKEEGRPFSAADGSVLPIGHSRNPYGRVWLDLGSSLGIHSSNEKTPTRLGCISLSPVDAADVFAILSAGSTIVIR
jgi:hypothetical protein